MTEYDNTGTVSLWGNVSDNPKAPQFKGKIYAHRDIRAGEEVSLSLWSNQRANPHGPDYNEKAPRFTGRIEDKYDPNVRSQPANASAESRSQPDDFDDDIPF